MAPDGIRRRSPVRPRPARLHPGGEAAVMAAERDAAIHHAFMKRLRLWEWQVGLVLEGLEALNATLAQIEALKGAER